MTVLATFGQAVPLALLFSLPVALLGGLLLTWARRRSMAVALTVLVLVPLVAALAGVLGVSGFMYTPQLVQTIVVCVVVAAVAVPAGMLLGRRLAADALWQREAHESERQAEAARRELVAGMSHDLRSPLAGIRGMTDAVLDGIVHRPDEVVDYLQRIRRESVRMNDMVEDLFQLSRATSSQLQLVCGRIALGEVVSDAAAAEAAGATAAGVTVRADHPEVWPTVLASDVELTRVVRNVLSNAVRHTPAGGTVLMTAGTSGDGAWLDVHDECGGIADADLPRVFDAGFRGTTARTPGEHSGAGLGLAIAKALVEAQQGRISIVNEGSGCRVRIELPLATRVSAPTP